MRRILAPLLGLVALGALAGCNTIEGAGRDLQAGGRVISDSAEGVKEKIRRQ